MYKLLFLLSLFQLAIVFLTVVVNSAAYICDDFQCSNEAFNIKSNFDPNDPDNTDISSTLCEYTCEGYKSCVNSNISIDNIISFSLLCYGLLSCDNTTINSINNNYMISIIIEFSADIYSSSSTFYLKNSSTNENSTYLGYNLNVHGNKSSHIDISCHGSSYNNYNVKACHHLFVENDINSETDLKFYGTNDGHYLTVDTNANAKSLSIHCSGNSSCHYVDVYNYNSNSNSNSNSTLINIDCTGTNSCLHMSFDNNNNYNANHYHNISLNCISNMNSCSYVDFNYLHYRTMFNIKCTGAGQCNHMNILDNKHLLSSNVYCNGSNSCQHFKFVYNNNIIGYNSRHNNNNNLTFEFNGRNNGDNMFILLSNVQQHVYIKCYNFSCYNATIVIINARSVHIDCDSTSCHNVLKLSIKSVRQLISSLPIIGGNNNGN